MERFEKESLPATGSSISLQPPSNNGLTYAQEESVENDDTWTTLKREWRTPVWVGLTVWMLVLGVTFASGMQFRARGRLYLGELSNQPSRIENTQQVDIWHPVSGDMGTEIEILTSQTLLVRAALKSGLNAEIRPTGWEPPSYWRWLMSGRNPRLLAGASKTLAVRDATLPEEARDRRKLVVKFETSTSFELFAGGRLVGAGELGTPVSAEGATLTLLPGSEGPPAPASRYTVEITPLPRLLATLSKYLTVTTAKTPGSMEPVKVATLEFTHASPQRAAAFLRSLMDEYLEQRHAWRKEEATAAESFVSSQLQELRNALHESERRLAQYRSTTPGVVLDNEAKALVEQIGRSEEQRVAARLEVAALSDMKRALNDPNPTMEAFLPGEAGDSVLWGFATSVSQARTELVQMEQRLPANHPQLRDQRAKVSAQMRMVHDYVSSKHLRSQEKLTSLNRVIENFESRLKAVPGAELGLLQLARESDVYSKLYSYLLEREQQVAIIKASTVSKNRVLDAPMIVYREYSPQLLLRLASLLPGLLLGIGVVLLRRRMSSALQTENDVRRSAKGQAIAVIIPQLPARGRKSRMRPQHDLDLFAPGLDTTYAESFRMLRASLTRRSGWQRGQIVLVTSPSPADGKTTCAFGLTAAFAAVGKNVLLIDGDVRKPSHHGVVESALAPGLSDILEQPTEWLQATQRVSLALGDFLSMAAGSSANPELLSADGVKPLFTELRQHFDWVIVDVASFPLASDALSLCSVVDHVVSVVRLNHTSRSLASEHIRQIAENTTSYSLVVNGGPVARHPAYGAIVRHDGSVASSG